MSQTRTVVVCGVCCALMWAASCNRGPDDTASLEAWLAAEQAKPLAEQSKKASEQQQQWSEEAGMPVEITNSIGMKLRLIPPGEFLMGEPEDGEHRPYFEFPHHVQPLPFEYLHRVRITKPFYLGTYEVTQAEYQKVMGENPSSFKGATRPVEWVSWFQAAEFCRKLSAREGRTYRLPTEAEWEYACRAGTTTRFYWGDSDAESVMKDYCWYEKNANPLNWTEPHAAKRGTQPVGQKRPNPWGLYDMSGNVWELCQDKWNRGYYDRSPETDPQGPPGWGAGRVPRGGAWNSPAVDCRSANRSFSVCRGGWNRLPTDLSIMSRNRQISPGWHTLDHRTRSSLLSAQARRRYSSHLPKTHSTPTSSIAIS